MVTGDRCCVDRGRGCPPDPAAADRLGFGKSCFRRLPRRSPIVSAKAMATDDGRLAVYWRQRLPDCPGSGYRLLVSGKSCFTALPRSRRLCRRKE